MQAFQKTCLEQFSKEGLATNENLPLMKILTHKFFSMVDKRRIQFKQGPEIWTNSNVLCQQMCAYELNNFNKCTSIMLETIFKRKVQFNQVQNKEMGWKNIILQRQVKTIEKQDNQPKKQKIDSLIKRIRTICAQKSVHTFDLQALHQKILFKDEFQVSKVSLEKFENNLKKVGFLIELVSNQSPNFQFKVYKSPTNKKLQPQKLYSFYDKNQTDISVQDQKILLIFIFEPDQIKNLCLTPITQQKLHEVEMCFSDDCTILNTKHLGQIILYNIKYIKFQPKGNWGSKILQNEANLSLEVNDHRLKVFEIIIKTCQQLRKTRPSMKKKINPQILRQQLLISCQQLCISEIQFQLLFDVLCESMKKAQYPYL